MPANVTALTCTIFSCGRLQHWYVCATKKELVFGARNAARECQRGVLCGEIQIDRLCVKTRSALAAPYGDGDDGSEDGALFGQ